MCSTFGQTCDWIALLINKTPNNYHIINLLALTHIDSCIRYNYDHKILAF